MPKMVAAGSSRKGVYAHKQKQASPAERPAPYLTCRTSLDVQVLYVQSILFDELTPRFHILAHERAED